MKLASLYRPPVKIANPAPAVVKMAPITVTAPTVREPLPVFTAAPPRPPAPTPPPAPPLADVPPAPPGAGTTSSDMRVDPRLLQTRTEVLTPMGPIAPEGQSIDTIGTPVAPPILSRHVLGVSVSTWLIGAAVVVGGVTLLRIVR